MLASKERAYVTTSAEMEAWNSKERRCVCWCVVSMYERESTMDGWRLEIAVFYSYNLHARSTRSAPMTEQIRDRGDFAFAAIRRMASRRSSASMIASSSRQPQLKFGNRCRCRCVRRSEMFGAATTLADAGSRGWALARRACGPETVCGRGDGKSRAPLFQCGVSGGLGAVRGIGDGDGRGDGRKQRGCDDAEVTEQTND